MITEQMKPQLLEIGILEVLIPLTNSPSIEVQGNSAAALGNLTSRGDTPLHIYNVLTNCLIADVQPGDDTYRPFIEVWDQPDGGMHAYLYRFLSSSDPTFQHIAVWTLVQLLESRDPDLLRRIKESPLLLGAIRELTVSRSSSVDGSSYARGQEDEDDEEGENGKHEIAELARRIIAFSNGEVSDGEDGYDSEAPEGQEVMVGQVRGERARYNQRDRSVASSRRSDTRREWEEDQLRQSVRNAFGSQR
jgi:vacuolar protein 8